jgi:ATP-dependent DNA helicase 2 subunit 2
MPDRAGYQVSLYAIDVSPSMGEEIQDPGGSSSKAEKKTKLALAKEYVARKCEPKVGVHRLWSKVAPLLSLADVSDH